MRIQYYWNELRNLVAVISWMLLACCIGGGHSARILGVMPFPGKSHHLFASSIFKTLAERGHQVVTYTPFPPKTPIPNLTHIAIHTRFEEKLDNWDYEDMKESSYYDSHLFKIRKIWEINYDVCEDTFKDKNIQKLLNSNEKFDLVIVEPTFGEESLLVFGHRFGVPTVAIEPCFLWSAPTRDSGNSLSIAYYPELLPFTSTDQMNFIERMLNLIAVSSGLFFYYNTHIPLQEEILKRNYPNAPPLTDMISNVSLYFTNSDPATINYIRPYTPNIIPIGGIHIVPERHPLPENIQKFMDDGDEGVIYFSLGTVIPTHKLPSELLQIFINVFKRIPQRVLWKIDLPGLPSTSNNVMVTKWVPQPGILAHPNCALFMTHGGLLSQQEAVYAGVPTVGIPVFTDQPHNIRYNEHRGIGVKLDLYSLYEEKLNTAINTILENATYKENAKRMSHMYRDRPMSPADSVVFWVEYVIRHGGAAHLRPASAYLTWYQLALLDVLAVVLGALLSLFIVVYLIIKKFLSIVCTKTKQTKSFRDKKKD